MFKGTLSVIVQKKTGHDAYGTPELEQTTISTAMGSVIKLKTSISNSQKTGEVYEDANTSVVLVPVVLEVQIGDKLIVQKKELEVIAIEECYDTRGSHHHNRVECKGWR